MCLYTFVLILFDFGEMYMTCDFIYSCFAKPFDLVAFSFWMNKKNVVFVCLCVGRILARTIACYSIDANETRKRNREKTRRIWLDGAMHWLVS